MTGIISSPFDAMYLTGVADKMKLIFPNTHISTVYINLRRSRDGRVFVCLGICYPRFIQFPLASFYAVHINALSI